MRISVVIICSVLIAQTSASFFSELTTTVSSVRFSVGKLLGDAVVDLKDTFDCTVFAVRQAFSSVSTVPDYYQKCQGDKTEDTMPLTPSSPVQINIISIVEPTSANIYRSSQLTNREQNNLKQKPDTSSDKKNEKKIQSVESYLLGETRILANMSSKLDHEFEDLSKHVNYDFTKIENFQKQLIVKTLMQGMDNLHKQEVIHRNNTESEIPEVFNRLTKPYNSSNDKHKIVLKEEIKAFTEVEQHKNMTHMQNEFKKWKGEELESLNNIKDVLKKQEKNYTMKPDQTLTTTSNSSKTEQSTETVTTAKSVTSTEPEPSSDIITSTKATRRTPLVQTTTKPAKTTKNNLIKSNHYLLRKDNTTLGQALKLNNTESKIPEVFDRLTKLDSNSNHTHKIVLKEEIKAFTELEQDKNETHMQNEFKKWKGEELESLNDIKDVLKKQEKNYTIKPDQTLTTTSNSSKTEKSTETVTTAKSVTSTEPEPSSDIITFTKATRRTPLVLTTTKPAKTGKNNLIKSNHYLLRKDNTTLGQALKQNNTESKIPEVFDRLTKLDSNSNHTHKIVLKEEIKAFTELEQDKNETHMQNEFKKWKGEELESLNDIKDVLKKQEKKYTMKPDQTLTTTSNSSKTEKSTETFTTAKPVTSTEPEPSSDIITSTKATRRTPLVLTTTKPAKTAKNNLTKSNHYLLSKDNTTLGQALKLNNTESKIPEVFDRLTKLDSNYTHKIILKEEIKELTEFEQNKNKTHVQNEFKQWKEELESLNDIMDVLKKQEKNCTMKPNQTLTTTSNSSKTEISMETVPTTKPAISTEPEPSADIITSTKATRRTPLLLTTTKPAKTTKNNLIKSNHYLLRKDNTTLGQALKLFSKGKKTSSLMAKILKRTKSEPNVFDHPELFIGKNEKK